MKKKKASIVAFFGPDGSGKSTVCSLWMEKLEAAGIKYSHFHWRPGFLPYKNKSKNNNSDSFNDPHDTKVRPPFMSFCILIYTIMDFILGYLFWFRKRGNENTYICYERYFYDLLIDQKRYGLLLPQWVLKLFSCLVPSPDYILLFDAPADILYARKKEISPEALEVLRRDYHALFKNRANCHIIDVAANDPEQCCNIINGIVGIDGQNAITSDALPAE